MTGERRRAALVERLMGSRPTNWRLSRVDERHLEDVLAVRDMAGALRKVTVAAATAVDKSLKLEEADRPQDSMARASRSLWDRRPGGATPGRCWRLRRPRR